MSINKDMIVAGVSPHGDVPQNLMEIRGPEDSALHAPAALLADAASAQCTHEREWVAFEIAILQFAEQHSAPRLVVKMSIGCLQAGRKRLVAVRQGLLLLGVPPSRIVIDLTKNGSVTDFSGLQEILQDFRRIGIQITMDDMGEGSSDRIIPQIGAKQPPIMRCSSAMWVATVSSY